MKKIAEASRDTLKALREIMVVSLQLLRLIKRYPAFFGGLVLIGLLCATGIYISYLHPANVIRSYYSSLKNKHPEEAWRLLEPNFQKAWKNGLQTFEQGYSTTVSYRNLEISPQETVWNPLAFLFTPSLTYDVSFEVEDRFTKEDFDLPVQRRANLLWLQLAHPKDSKRLLEGTFEDNSLVLRRYYTQEIVVTRASWKDSLIAKINTRQLGIRQ